jgi:hypothetical protein
VADRRRKNDGASWLVSFLSLLGTEASAKTGELSSARLFGFGLCL